MQQIKEFLNFIDVIVGTFWGFTLYEIVPVLSAGTIALNQIDNLIKISFSLVGLIYAIVRMNHFIQMSKLNKEYRQQEIIEKKLSNLKQQDNENIRNTDR